MLRCTGGGAETQRPMHNSESDREVTGPLDAANLRVDLARIRCSAMRGEVTRRGSAPVSGGMGSRRDDGGMP